jgi:hypothetical protein
VWVGKREGIEVEFSAHVPPRSLAREIPLVFSQCKAAAPPVVAPVFFRCACDLVTGNRGEADAEKDAMLERFVRWVLSARAALADRAGGEPAADAAPVWIDGTDPASGRPLHEPSGPSFYPDVHGAQAVLGYRTYDAGGCGVLSHPVWGTAVYPATMFAGRGLSLEETVAIMSVGLDEPPQLVERET